MDKKIVISHRITLEMTKTIGQSPYLKIRRIRFGKPSYSICLFIEELVDLTRHLDDAVTNYLDNDLEVDYSLGRRGRKHMMTSRDNAGRLYLAIAAIDDGERVGGLNLVSREEIDGFGKSSSLPHRLRPDVRLVYIYIYIYSIKNQKPLSTSVI